MKFITGEDLNTPVVTKSKERYIPKLEFDEALQEAFTKFVQGDFWWVRVEGFLRKIYKCKRQVVIKNKIRDIPRQMYQKEVLRICKTMAWWETFFISGSSRCGKSKILKDLARRINIINGKSINSIYTAPTVKDGKTYDLIDSEYKAQDVTIFDDISASFGFRSS